MHHSGSLSGDGKSNDSVIGGAHVFLTEEEESEMKTVRVCP